MRTRAVLLRFDGVIADIANVHIAAWERTFGRIGWEVSPEVCARSAEIDDREFLESVFDSRSIDGDVDGWVARKQALMVQMLGDWPRLYPGVPEFVGSLSGRVRLAILSMTWRENVATVLRKCGLGDAFELIVSKEDLRGSNPGMDLHRIALKRLAIDAADAVAFEDSPSGLAAATAAGIPVIAVGHRRAPGVWVNGAAYVESLADAKVS